MRIDRWRKGDVLRALRGLSGRVCLAVLLGLIAVAGCSRNDPPETDAAPVPETTLRVENQAFLDMTIYAVRSSQRVRLGIATGLSVTKFTIPKSLIFGSTPLAFYADPIGGRRTPVSQEVMVSPGDEVQLMIPPG